MSTMMISDDVLGFRDIVDGSIIAFCLALFVSYLRRDSSSSSSSSLDNEVATYKETPEETKEQEGGVIFDAESWEEMSRPENYIYYNPKLKNNQQQTAKEKRWVLAALLILFVPIFSFEFFLALSRQFWCGGDPFQQSEWARELCSPHVMD